MLDDREPESRPAHVARTAGIHAIEPFEQARQVPGLDPWSTVGHENRKLARRRARLDRDAGSVGAILERVVDEVGENAIEGALVAIGPGNSAAMVTMRSILREVARSAKGARLFSLRAARSRDSRFRRYSLASIFDRSSRSSTSSPRRRPLRSMMPTNWMAALGSRSMAMRRVSAAEHTEAMGVRSSCDTLVTKSRRTISRRRISVTSNRTSSKARGSPDRRAA